MKDIAVLFARDPLKLTTDDIDTIIKEIRKRRDSFSTAAPSRKRETKTSKLLQGLDVEIDV